MTEHDKLLERARYDARAESQMMGKELVVEVALGSQNMPAYLRTPYLVYEQKIAELIRPPEFDSSRHFRHAYSNEINNLEAVFAFFCGGTFYAK